MCDGGGGGGGEGGMSGVGEAGTSGGTGGSGGNVGPGVGPGPGIGNTAIGLSYAGELGAADIGSMGVGSTGAGPGVGAPSPATTASSSFYGGWEQASMPDPASSSPPGLFGMTPTQLASTSFVLGSMVNPVVGLIAGLGGYLAGYAQGGGGVGPSGGPGDPGTIDPNAPSQTSRGPIYGDEGVTFLGGGGSAGGMGIGEALAGRPGEKLGFSGDFGLSMYKGRQAQKAQQEYMEDIMEAASGSDYGKFTRSLF